MLQTNEPRALSNRRSTSAAHQGLKNTQERWGHAAVSRLGVFFQCNWSGCTQTDQRKIPEIEWPINHTVWQTDPLKKTPKNKKQNCHYLKTWWSDRGTSISEFRWKGHPWHRTSRVTHAHKFSMLCCKMYYMAIRRYDNNNTNFNWQSKPNQKEYKRKQANIQAHACTPVQRHLYMWSEYVTRLF